MFSESFIDLNIANEKNRDALNLLRQSFSMNASDSGLRCYIAYTLMKLDRSKEALKEINALFSDFSDFDSRPDAEALKKQLSNL